MSQGPVNPMHDLEGAFQAFNQVSQQLAASYQELECRVLRLNEELESAHHERLAQRTEKERLADRLQTLLKAMPAGVVVLDGAGCVRECNPAARELLGEPLLGVEWMEIIRRAFAPRNDDGHEVSLRDGRLVSISTQSLGGEPGQVLLLQDVTEARCLQERLSRHKRLSAMGEMAARLAHQIRTPLSSALLYASHLTRRGSPDDAQRFAEKIVSSLRQLEALVNDVLIFAKGGEGSEEINIATLMEELQASMEAHLRAAGCTLRVVQDAGDARPMGNRRALLCALQNLLSNAMQVCGRDGEIGLRVTSAAEQGGAKGLILTVEDNGPGIPETVRDRIFEPFFTTRSRGTGLGLAVVHAVAQAHHGAAWVDSEEGAGSAFHLYLPLNLQHNALPSGGCHGQPAPEDATEVERSVL